MKLPIIISFVSAAVSFAIVFFYNFFSLLSKQPPTDGSPFPSGVTAFPPSSAWIVALPVSAGIFCITLVLMFFLRKYSILTMSLCAGSILFVLCALIFIPPFFYRATVDLDVYFGEQLSENAFIRVGIIKEATDASYFLHAFASLAQSDFHGVTTLEGVYKMRGDVLVFEPTSFTDFHTDGELVTGKQQLLKNISQRRAVEVTTKADVDHLVGMLIMSPEAKGRSGIALFQKHTGRGHALSTAVRELSKRGIPLEKEAGHIAVTRIEPQDEAGRWVVEFQYENIHDSKMVVVVDTTGGVISFEERAIAARTDRATSSVVILSLAEARVLAEQFLADQNAANKDKTQKIALSSTAPQEYSFGWVFFAASEKYIETGGPIGDMIPGMGPLVVDRKRHVQFLSSAPLDVAVKEYERQFNAGL